MKHHSLVISLGAAIASVSIAAAALSLAPIARAVAGPVSQLLPALGTTQSFSMTLSLRMPKPDGGDDRGPNLTMKVAVRRASADTVNVTADGGIPGPPTSMSEDGRQTRVYINAVGMGSGGQLQAHYAINAGGLLEPGDAPHPFVGVYDDALIVGRAASAHRVGDSWNTTIEMFGPAGPPMAGGIKRGVVEAQTQTVPSDGEGPPRVRATMMVVVPAPQPISLHLRVVSMQGETIKVEGSGNASVAIETPRGASRTAVTMSVEETIVGGRLVYYSESTSSRMPGPNGTMDIGSTTRLVAN